MEEKIFYLSGLLFLISACFWYLTKMWEIGNSKKEKKYLEEKLSKSEEYRKRELDDVSKFYKDKIDYMKSQAKGIYGVPKMQNPPLPPPKKDKKFKKQQTVNKNIIDPTTGDRMLIVQCFCGTIYTDDSYAAYGCDCEKKIINKK